MSWTAALRRVLRRLSAARRAPGAAPAPEALEVAVVALGGDELHNLVRRLQLDLMARHGVHLGLAATPHVTLKLGFPARTLEPLERHLDELAAATGAFEARARGVGLFDEGVLYLDVEPSPRLEALRARIVGELAERFGVRPHALEEAGRFRFHVTLARGVPAADLARARRALDAERLDVRFPVEHLALLYCVGEHWVTHRRARLAGAPLRAVP